MSGARFRPATRADVPAIVGLLADDMLGKTREFAGRDRYLAAFDAMQAQSGNAVFVAEDADGGIVACYQLTLIDGLSLSASRRAQIEGVRVASHLRGHGLGAALMADAEQRARDGGAVLLQLTSNAQRQDALRFYEAAGFVASHIGFKKRLD